MTLDSLGLGVDLQEIAAFDDLDDRHDARFYERVFSAAEREYCLGTASPAEHYAVRFAAKEAVVKALSKFESVALEQVEVVRGEDGRPGVRLHVDGAARYAIELSLSHSESHGIAVAAVEQIN